MASQRNDNFPFEICDVDPETNAAMVEQFEDVKDDGFVRVGPKGYVFPKMYLNDAPALYNMQTRPDQVFVAGFPRSGTTWVQQLVWLIMNDLDYAENEKTTMTDKCKYLEIQAVIHEKALKKHILENKGGKIAKENLDFVMSNAQSVEELTQNHSFFKTHLPLSLLPPKILETSKIVYVARDPRDTIVSFYHLCKGTIWPFKKDFKSMWNSFYKGTLYFCPYFEHVKEFWEKRNNPNLLFLFYEDFRNDRLNTLRRVANFFNKSYTEEQLLAACRYLDFNNLKDKKSFNLSCLKEHGVMKPDAEPFVRRGMVGEWREYFDEDMTREAEQWIADNLRDTDLRFTTMKLQCNNANLHQDKDTEFNS